MAHCSVALIFLPIFLVILCPRCKGISVHCNPTNLQGNRTVITGNILCSLSRSLRKNETGVWTFQNCTTISTCTTGGCNETIAGYHASFNFEKHEYFLYKLRETRAGPYLFSVHDVGNMVAQSVISGANITDLDCTVYSSTTCHCVDSNDVSSDKTYLEHQSASFISKTHTQTNNESPTIQILNVTNSAFTSAPVTSSSPHKISMNTHGPPIFVYAIIALVAGFLLLSSLCMCFIGCQMYKRRTFQPETRFVDLTVIPDVQRGMHLIAAAHSSVAAQCPARVSTNTISSSAHNRESNFDFYEKPYAFSNESNPPLPPRSWQTPKRDFSNVLLNEDVQKDKPLYSLICDSESGSSASCCSSLTGQKSVREDNAYEEPYTTCNCDERSVCSAKSDILSENDEIRRESIQNAQKEDDQESETPNYLSEATQAHADTSTVKTTLTGGNHSYELTVPVFVNHTPLLSPSPCTLSDYDRLHRNHLSDFGHDGRASEAMQHTSVRELGARIFTFPPDLEPDEQEASPHIYNTLEQSTTDEKDE